ncbi:hypothetical protein RB653_009481 [Dictyostelium firmibasis]|uniref:FHA domain-containing protein n=1 Tax=Dictyostelium firmibasis TaxID=79012 RepID=A0AAN7TUB3_9MYCE
MEIHYTPFIRVVYSTGNFNDFNLNIGVTNIGRGNSNDIALDDPIISSINSSLYFDGYTFSFFDLSESNKTYIKYQESENSILLEPNTPYQIINGTRIQLSNETQLILLFCEDCENNHQNSLNQTTPRTTTIF